MIYIAYALLYGLALFQAGFHYDALPGTVATHFAPGGAPDGFMSRDGFICFHLLFSFFMPGLMLGFSLLLRRIPPRLLNFPNKKYWLAAPRRDEAMARLARGLQCLGLLTGLFLIAVMQLVIRTNLRQPVQLDENPLFVMLGLFAGVMAGFLVWVWSAFRIPEKA